VVLIWAEILHEEDRVTHMVKKALGGELVAVNERGKAIRNA
jgi:hypothetical protein